MFARRKIVGIAAGLALMGLWIGVAQAEDPATLHEGDQVDLTGEVEGKWLTVAEGPHAGERFALVENHALEELEDAGLATATYRISGKALEYRGTNRILISSFQRMSASTPVRQYQEDPGTATQRTYREGS